jgi:Tol biopolymer transport system component
VTERVSVASDGTQANGPCFSPSITGDGRFVAFNSEVSIFVPGDVNDNDDVFLHDRQTGVTERVSVASDGSLGDSWSRSPRISGDGRWVAFQSWTTNLVPGDTNGQPDVLVTCNPMAEKGKRWWRERWKWWKRHHQ